MDELFKILPLIWLELWKVDLGLDLITRLCSGHVSNSSCAITVQTNRSVFLRGNSCYYCHSILWPFLTSNTTLKKVYWSVVLFYYDNLPWCTHILAELGKDYKQCNDVGHWEGEWENEKDIYYHCIVHQWNLINFVKWFNVFMFCISFIKLYGP